jgi:hypothetical protein
VRQVLGEYAGGKSINTLGENISANTAQCDKVGRGASGSDPCSECRWFNGNDGAQPCVLSEMSSVSDELWSKMRIAMKTKYQRLVASKTNATKEGKQPKEVKPAPKPMASEALKNPWNGKSKEELLDLPGCIPQDVHEHPRAYTVLIRPGNNVVRSKEYIGSLADEQSIGNIGSSSKRPHESASTSQGPH